MRALLFSKKDLTILIVPLIIEQMLEVLVGMVDVVMVSSVGEAAVSGVSLVDMINVLIINIFAALATGGAVVAAQYLGAKKPGKACQTAKQLLIVTFFFSLVIMGLCLTFQYQILRLLFGSIADDVMSHALTYLWISALSYPFLAVYNACAALFRAMGNSKISMKVSLYMNIIHIVGNLVFLLGFRLGVAGVAISSLIARGVACGILLFLLRNPANQIFLEKGQKWRLNFKMIRKILHIGIPNGLENSLFQLGRVLVVSIIAGFGTVQIAANAVANNIDGLGVIPGQALSLATITVIGHCVGAGDYDQAKYYAKKLMKISYTILISWNAVLLLTLPLTMKLYNLSDETLWLATVLVFIHNGCAMALWTPSFVLPNVLRASNDVRYTMVVSIFSMGMFRLVFSYILGIGMGLGAIGVWIAMVMDWIFRVICFVARYLRGKWMLQKI